METKQKIFVALGTLAVVGVAVFGGKMLLTGDSVTSASAPVTPTQSQSVSTVTPSATTNNTSSQPSASTSQYKDGQYTATQSYNVPHGAVNSLTVTLTLSGGKISAVTTNNDYSDRESQMYVSSFEDSLSASAVGQSLSGYSPSRIGGASLTTEAFYQALSTVKTKAS